MRLFQNFRFARIVKGYRWYIEYYQMNPKTGFLDRFRETYQINRIKNLRDRQKKAEELCEMINRQLPNGFPFNNYTDQQLTNVIDAIEFAVKLKSKGTRSETKRGYNGYCNILMQYLKGENLGNMGIIEFDNRKAITFLDYLQISRDVGPVTYNNYVTALRSIFSVLVDRYYINENPFSGIKKNEAWRQEKKSFFRIRKKSSGSLSFGK